MVFLSGIIHLFSYYRFYWLLFAFTLKVSEYQPPPSTAKHHRLSWDDFIETKAIPIAIIGFLTAFAYASILSFISVYAETRGVFEYVSLFFIVFAAAMISVRPFTGDYMIRKVRIRSFIRHLSFLQ